jgi:hypothetical protein
LDRECYVVRRNTCLVRMAKCGLFFILASAAGKAISEDAVPIRIGESELYTGVTASYFTDDNALRRNVDKIKASGWLLSPYATLKADQRTVDLSVSYIGEYKSSSEDSTDYANHRLLGAASAEFSRRSRGSLTASISRTHEDLGDGFTRFNPEAFDTTIIDRTSLEVRHIFGVSGARGNINSALRFRALGYSNNSQLTSGRDQRTIRPSVALSFRVAGSTRAFFGVNVADIDFDDNRRDRQETTGFLGLNWNEEEKSGGSLIVGSTQASFDSGDREDKSTLSYTGSLWYLPLPYSRFELTLKQSFEDDGSSITADGTEVDDLTVKNEVQIDWRHQWSTRVSHVAGLDYESFDVECPANNESTTSASLKGNLKVRRWLSMGLGVVNRSRKSKCDELSLDYDQVTVLFSVTATL